PHRQPPALARFCRSRRHGRRHARMVVRRTARHPEILTRSPRMSKVVMYSKDYCPYCARAQALLKQRGVADLEIIRIDQDPSQRDVMIERTGRRTVPQIFIGDKHIGGCDDLIALDRAGGLEPLLKA